VFVKRRSKEMRQPHGGCRRLLCGRNRLIAAPPHDPLRMLVLPLRCLEMRILARPAAVS